MKDTTTYMVRDNKKLLKDLNDGTRSQFIRESIEDKLKMNKQLYDKESLELEEFIKFYNEILLVFEESSANLEKQMRKVTTHKNNITKTIKKLEKMQKTRQKLLKIQTKIEEEQEESKNRKMILNEIIKNLLKRKDDPTIPLVNFKYLQQKGNYKNLKELYKDLSSYIKSLNETDTFNGQRILKEDLNYLKKIRW